MWSKIIYELTRFEAFIFLFLIPCCIIGAIGWRNLSWVFRVLVIFVWFDFLIEIFSRVLSHTIRNNYPIFHLYVLGQVLLWGLFYRELLPKSFILARYWKGITGITMVAVVLNSIFLQPLTSFCSYSLTLVQVVIILFSLAFTFSFLDDTAVSNNAHLKKLQQINWAILLYNCGSLFIFMFGTFLNTEAFSLSAAILWKINISLNLILHLVILLNLCKVIYNPQKL